MYKITICLTMLMITGSGCRETPPEIGITRDNFSYIKKSSTGEIEILSAAFTPGGMPYHYRFSIFDPRRIHLILECMQNAKPIDENEQLVADLKKNNRLLIFKTQRAHYSTKITWNDDFVYGTWDMLAVENWSWKSSEMREYFRKWNLIEEISAADPQWPDPDWMTTPPPDSDSSLPPLDFQNIESKR